MNGSSVAPARLLACLLILAATSTLVADFPLADPQKVEALARGERDVADPTWWGVDPLDVTEALQAAIDSGAQIVRIPNVGHDWIVRPLRLRSDQTILFEPGVRLLAEQGAFHGRSDSVLIGERLSNVRLIGYGATIQMRKQDYMTDAYAKAEWRMCILLRSCRDVEIAGLTLRDSGGDGTYLGRSGEVPHNENVVIRDVVCDNNYRQGLCVISVRNLLVENSVFSNTSGTGPSAGIDLEPNRADQELTGIVIRNCAFLDNANLGMHMWRGNLNAESSPIEVIWEGNYVRGGRVGIHISSMPRGPSRGRIVFRNNIIERTQGAGVLIRRKGIDTARVTFEGALLIDAPVRFGRFFGTQGAPIVLHAQSRPTMFTTSRAASTSTASRSSPQMAATTADPPGKFSAST